MKHNGSLTPGRWQRRKEAESELLPLLDQHEEQETRMKKTQVAHPIPVTKHGEKSGPKK